ncbi:hypothetical protein L2E82_11972 [Cichorium intybus]|uniref:Uncharacterized protein n=1 Tax=Cichorium intybus TaxID=13427 RepID=A0ACB9GE91_CICIN|nr:hypothetical protein L2E82_11972 [Cichorium intybus]
MMYGTTSAASHLRPPAASKTSFLRFSDRPEPPLASFLPPRPPAADFISLATSSRFLLADKALSDQFDPLLKKDNGDELEQEVMQLAKEQEL